MKKNVKWTVLSLVLLFGFPFLTAKFAGVSGMVLCFMMFSAVNPVFFAAEGIASGKNIKKHWFMPLVSALIYLLSMWVVFDMGETDFILYSGIYLAIGTVAMLITSAVRSK